MNKISKLLLIVFVYHFINAKILIITPVFNRPDFIEYQYKTFKKFLKDDYEFKVFNDAIDPAKELEIRQMCDKLQIECIRVPQNLHNVNPNCYRAPASFRHGESVQFALNNYGFKHNDILVIIDSDVFLINMLSFTEFLNNNDGYILSDYFKPQLCILNIPKLKNIHDINFQADYINGKFYDGGELTKFYIANHQELKLRKYSTSIGGLVDLNLDNNIDLSQQLKEKGYTNLEIKLIKSIIDCGKCANEIFIKRNSACYDADIAFYETNLFLDYKHGSGWHGPNAHIVRQKDKIIKDFFDELLK